jgi:hypothetical protein
LDVGKDRIEISIGKLVSMRKVSQEEADATLERMTFRTDMDALKDTDYIVEAVIEKMDRLGRLRSPGLLLGMQMRSVDVPSFWGLGKDVEASQQLFITVSIFLPLPASPNIDELQSIRLHAHG